VKDNGYYLSTEAIVSLLLLGLLLSTPLHESNESLSNLHVFKKENDLLLLWAGQWPDLSEKQIVQDFEFAFPGKAGQVFWKGKTIEIGAKGEDAIASEIVFFDRFAQKQSLGIVVFK